jgi:hypothetical protein
VIGAMAATRLKGIPMQEKPIKRLQSW